jgi:signal transduction histidine kinase
VRGDPTRLRQALLNYGGNAVKFTDQGSIALRARLLDEQGDELLVRFEVEDTGRRQHLLSDRSAATRSWHHARQSGP